MKRLALVGEGEGDASALPILLRKILREKRAEEGFFVDSQVIRAGEAAGLIRWKRGQLDCNKWLKKVALAARRRDLGGILAVFDGDGRVFPAGSSGPFCASMAAKVMAQAAVEKGAGKVFSLAVAFACVEFETWIIAGVESLVGKTFDDGRPVLLPGTTFPMGDPESHGKRWLKGHLPGYRETRDQGPLTELLDLNVVRSKNIRSFARLEHAVEQLLEASAKGICISSRYRRCLVQRATLR